MSHLCRHTLDPVQEEVLNLSAERFRGLGAVLAGGLSVALRFGHRRSRDLDWFVPADADLQSLAESLSQQGDITLTTNEPGTVHGRWRGIPFSVIRYRYRLGSDLIDDVPLADLRTVSGMKLLAVLNRGARRDFIDIAACLTAGVALATMIEYALQDIPGLTVESVLRALAYHRDAQHEPDPGGLQPGGWASAQSSINSAIRAYVASEGGERGESVSDVPPVDGPGDDTPAP